MAVKNNQSKIMKLPEKEKLKKQEEQKPNPIETIIIDILSSKNPYQKLWLSFQDIFDGFQNRAILIDYWNKSNAFKTALAQALRILEEKGKIEKKIFEQETYFSIVS
jgi:ribonuclease HIII